MTKNNMRTTEIKKKKNTNWRYYIYRYLNVENGNFEVEMEVVDRQNSN